MRYRGQRRGYNVGEPAAALGRVPDLLHHGEVDACVHGRPELQLHGAVVRAEVFAAGKQQRKGAAGDALRTQYGSTTSSI